MNQHAIKVFNRNRKIIQLDRAAKNFHQADFLFNESANRLANQFDEIIKKKFDRVLNIGSRNGYLTEVIKKTGLAKEVIETDISNSFLRNSKNKNNKILANEEFLPFKDESFDLIVSNLALHWVNDLPGCLVQIRRMLKKGGFFCANMFGGRTLVELRNAFLLAEKESGLSPRISPFVDVKDGASLLQRTKFDEPVSVSEDIVVKYSTLNELMKDLRNMGETNALEKLNNKFPGKDFFERVEKAYLENFSDEKKYLNASFEIVTISGWKK